MELLGPIAALGTVLVFVVGLFRSSIRVVAPNERIVIFRAGRADASLVRDPGRTLVLPFVDLPVLIDMSMRSLRVLAVEATTADGQDVTADLMVHVRVVDPLACAISVISLDDAVTRLVRERFAAAAATRTATEVRDGPELEAAVLDLVVDVVARWGAACSKVEIQRVAILAS